MVVEAIGKTVSVTTVHRRLHLNGDNANPLKAVIVDDFLKSEGIAARRLHKSNLLESSSNAFKVTGSIAFRHLSCYLATLDLNTLSNLNISYIFLELIGNKREFIFPKKTPMDISGKVPYRFVTTCMVLKAADGDRFNSCQVIYSQFGLTIHQNDHQARRRFVEWAQNEIIVVPDFHKRILFSDEAHFWFNGYVNKQNCRIWREANPQVYVETPLHPEKLTVWCALWAVGIIGPYFFKNDESHNVTVNGDQYRAMITNFFILELNNHDVQELWCQQDDAICHTARATIDLLKDTFGDRLISRFGPVNWPPRSCDLTPLVYFLWSYVKSLVYADKPQTLDHLEDNILRVIPDIRPQMLEKVIENWTSRLDYIRASRGSPMPEIIFKI
ncbi:putative transposable element [Trichonephila clavipes]|nr:putative transposable element [Trichonephila clavipes]